MDCASRAAVEGCREPTLLQKEIVKYSRIHTIVEPKVHAIFFLSCRYLCSLSLTSSSLSLPLVVVMNGYKWG